MKTTEMKATEQQPNAGMKLLPPRPDVCQECATDHTPEMPHNLHSLFYQYSFYEKNKRFPTWKDALAHCTPEMRSAWVEELAKRDIKVD